MAPWLALIVVFLISLPAVTPRFYASDEIEYFAYLRSLWFDHDLSFDNEYRYFYEHGVAQGARPREDGPGYYGSGFHETFLEATTETGLRINFAPIGTALLWSPFFVVADVGVRLARAFGSSVPADGFSFPYIAAVTYASAFYGFLSIVLSIVAVRRIIGTWDWTFAAVWLGTPLIFYMYVAPGFSHACSAFAVAAFVVIWLDVRREWSWSGVIALGAAAALMAMVREQDAFVASGPAVDYVIASVRMFRGGTRTMRTSVLRAVAGILALAVCFLPQAIAYIVLYGRLGPSPTVAQKMDWMSPHAWQLLTSTEHGFFFWTPLVVPAVAGLFCLALGRVRRVSIADQTGPAAWTGVLCLVMVASQIYVAGSLSTWMAANSFGQRRLVGLTVFLVVGLASLLQSVSSTWIRRGFSALVLVCVWWNLGLIAQFGTGLMNRDRLQLSRNVYDNFVTIPRSMPRLAYRYIFDRRSFYQTGARQQDVR